MIHYTDDTISSLDARALLFNLYENAREYIAQFSDEWIERISRDLITDEDDYIPAAHSICAILSEAFSAHPEDYSILLEEYMYDDDFLIACATSDLSCDLFATERYDSMVSLFLEMHDNN